MNDPRPTTGQIIAGMFMVLFGAAACLLGGSCTIIWLSAAAQTGAVFLLLISLIVLGGGSLSIWAGVKILRGHMRH